MWDLDLLAGSVHKMQSVEMCVCEREGEDRVKQRSRDKGRQSQSKPWNPISWMLIISHVCYTYRIPIQKLLTLQTIFTDIQQKQITNL